MKRNYNYLCFWKGLLKVIKMSYIFMERLFFYFKELFLGLNGNYKAVYLLYLSTNTASCTTNPTNSFYLYITNVMVVYRKHNGR